MHEPIPAQRRVGGGCRRPRVLFGGPPAPVQSQTAPRKLDLAHIIAPPESGAIGFKYLADEVTKRSNGQLNVVFHGGTLLGKELEIMDAVKSGNIAIGTPVGAACTVFPEMCVFLTPYLVRDYNHAYSMFNGEIGLSMKSDVTSLNSSRRHGRLVAVLCTPLLSSSYIRF